MDSSGLKKVSKFIEWVGIFLIMAVILMNMNFKFYALLIATVLYVIKVILYSFFIARSKDKTADKDINREWKINIFFLVVFIVMFICLNFI